MKLIYENIKPIAGSSFFVTYSSPGCVHPFWHIHPEYELVYVHSGSAEQHIGTNISRYNNGNLLLIGSNIPHSNLGNDDKSDNLEIVIQMSPDFVEKQIAAFPEFNKISELFMRASHGISFSNNIKNKVGLILNKITKASVFEKLIMLMEALQILAKSKEYTLLNPKSATIEVQSNDYNRINKINEFVSLNYNRPLQLSELSELTGLTKSSFSRFFKKVTGKTFIVFLNGYRVQKACSFLANKNTSISEVMANSGFIEPAHFTRTFKKYTKQTPSDYRKKIRFW